MDASTLFSVKGKVCLVTGGSRGIGSMMAEALVANGARVYIVSRKKTQLDAECARLNGVAAVSRLGGSCMAIAANLSSEAECEALAATVASKEPKLHVLVNNAGATWGEAIDSHPGSAFDKLMALNVRAVFSLTQKCLPLLRAAATATDPARVINIGSVLGIGVSMSDTYSYMASKAAVHHLTRALASKLAAEHITVNAIAPGPFPSEMTKFVLNEFGDEIVAGIPLKRIGKPADMAGVTLLLAGPAGSYITGTVIPIDGGGLVAASHL